MAETTPMMRQYLDIKEQAKDCILFFRLGDFYEMFFDDALLASRELDLTLTSRDRTSPEGERTPMCGVPYHSSEAYIARLIAKGYKVAICEQTEDPAQAQGLVKRGVVRVVTPGTVIDSSMLDEKRNNFIAGISLGSDGFGLCFADISTGEMSGAFFGPDDAQGVINELSRFAPREAILSDGAYSSAEILSFLQEKLEAHVENGGERIFSDGISRRRVVSHFGEGSEAASALEDLPAVGRAAGGLLTYLYETQKTDLSHLCSLKIFSKNEIMGLDTTARRNLELCETLRSKEKKGSLLWTLDATVTSMGSRLLRAWLEGPLLSPAAIRRRQGAVSELLEDSITRSELTELLKTVHDIERLIGRIVYGSANCRDLRSLCSSLFHAPHIKSLLEDTKGALLRDLCSNLDELSDITGLIDAAIVDDPPFFVREGGIIRDGFNPEVDRYRELIKNSHGMLAEIESRERGRTGIKNLKIGYNRVFGYYIEVSKSGVGSVPQDYIRKQTLSNCERYITEELKNLESEILSANERIFGLEYELFCQIRDRTAAETVRIQRTARTLAQLDVLCSFSKTASENDYCMPQIDLSDRIEITAGRHPVVESSMKNALFVPNDALLDAGENCVSIITGPNMAGKSTYMRQVALIVVMAQAGSFVPAKSANIGIVDRIFTRIGASDDLYTGQSTFMVEMTEMADILKNATKKSLLILDEIGRGTSTFDGMSIARAVLEFVANRRLLGAKTLFATHYHELTALEGELPGVVNYNIAAKKRGDEIIFLRKIVRGGADDSYGIEVAKLAGVPRQVISRAKEVLLELESGAPRDGVAAVRAAPDQVSLSDMSAIDVADRLRSIDLNVLTPIEAMNILFELKGRL